MHDLIIRNGRVVDWRNRINSVCDIAVEQGKIAEVGRVSGPARREVNAAGLIVVPGIIDTHMHASSWLGGPMGCRMLALAGVTTALEMAGPVESVKRNLKECGCGIALGCLQWLRPGINLPTNDPTDEDIERAAADALAKGAFGVKLLGGHYPLTPQASARVIKRCAERGLYIAVHAGTTTQGSDIRGMRQIIELADGAPFHLAHVNAYCRGAVLELKDELDLAQRLLAAHPEIDSESYLASINGSFGKCVDGIPENPIARNCLKSRGYRVDAQGMRDAIADGFAHVHAVKDGVTVLVEPQEGLSLWEAAGSDVPVSFEVNPALSRFFFALARRARTDDFLVDSFSTDGGGIPRNVIVSHGLSLVKFGALSLEEFVRKSSFAGARLLGLANKGHFSAGADADITVIDYDKGQAVHSWSMGRPVLENGVVVGTGGTLVAGESGRKAAQEAGLDFYCADIEGLFEYRSHRLEAAAADSGLQAQRHCA